MDKNAEIEINLHYHIDVNKELREAIDSELADLQSLLDQYEQYKTSEFYENISYDEYTDLIELSHKKIEDDVSAVTAGLKVIEDVRKIMTGGLAANEVFYHLFFNQDDELVDRYDDPKESQQTSKSIEMYSHQFDRL